MPYQNMSIPYYQPDRPQGMQYAGDQMVSFAEMLANKQAMQQQAQRAVQDFKMQEQIKADIKNKAEVDLMKQRIAAMNQGSQGGGAMNMQGASQGGASAYIPIMNPITGDITMKENPDYQIMQDVRKDMLKKNVEKSEKAETLGNVLNSIEQSWKKTSPYTSKAAAMAAPVGGMYFLGGLDKLKSGLQITQAQRNDKLYNDFVKGIRAQLARGMGDVGNLSEYEQTAVLNLVPTSFDTEEVGKEKLKNVRNLLEEIKKARSRGMTLDQFMQEMGSGSTQTQQGNNSADPLGIR